MLRIWEKETTSFQTTGRWINCCSKRIIKAVWYTIWTWKYCRSYISCKWWFGRLDLWYC